nr:MAG TPA: hypothetical protein [Caudoviricetes sp.]
MESPGLRGPGDFLLYHTHIGKKFFYGGIL